MAEVQRVTAEQLGINVGYAAIYRLIRDYMS